VVAPNGDVGIGTSTPTTKLDVHGKISLNSGEANNAITGETNTRRMTVGTAPTTNGASAFFEMFGDETQVGGIPGRAGEFNLAGRNIIVRANKQPGNFGVLALRIFPTNNFRVYSSVTEKQGNTAWTTFSDRRLKKDVRNFKKGLDEVLAINPVWFTYTGEMGLDNTREYVGVVAQEFQQIAPWDVAPIAQDDEVVTQEYLGINDSSVKYMLVNAIKEQQQQIEDKDERISDLEDRLAQLEALVNNSLEETATSTVELDSNKATLGQNVPNPTDGNTIISYTLPDIVSSASIQIYDMTGKMLKNVQLDNTKKGELTIQAGQLVPGTYSYTLTVDGAKVATKKMILSN